MEFNTATTLNSKSVKMYKWNKFDFSVYREETILYDASRNNRLIPYILVKRLDDYSDAERMLPLSSAANVYN